MKFHVIAVDLDGTLQRSDGSTSTRSRAALQATAASGATKMTRAYAASRSAAIDIANQSLMREHRLAGEAASQLVTQLRAAVPGVALASDALRVSDELSS